jgi:hypothetical protein
MPRGWSRDSLQSVPEPRRSHSVRSISEFRMRVESTWCPQTQSLFSKLSSLKRTANNGRANCPHKLTKAAGPLARRPSRLGRLELHARGTSAASSLLPLRVGRGSRRAAPSGRHVRRLLQLRVSTLGRPCELRENESTTKIRCRNNFLGLRRTSREESSGATIHYDGLMFYA